ncbi:hypothetical protein HPP92_012886 [Vanilla planifolia]|uniref:Kinesin motor domain-containing protein n=1 Tax=Vanilla planifolia TaxID=51239 RepID=A0A835QMD3_VANPL|nr:hypothetical protein HPP92_012886 [Vanilla planifolia]
MAELSVSAPTSATGTSASTASLSENEDLEAFYKRFVESRIEGVRSGAKCTIMMYGPTGAGKSHTMFGCAKQPGIVYRALRDILGDGDMDGGLDDAGFRLTLFVQVAVLEIYNEEIYDLLSGGNSNGSGSGIALPKGSIPKLLHIDFKHYEMVILDVPLSEGRLMLVDMAGSENIEQAGQAGFEAKLQTAKINQGNTALKRVVESIANGDSCAFQR